MRILNPTIARREFLHAGLASASVALLGANRSMAASLSRKDVHLCVFEKFLQKLSFDELADVVAELGFDGIEATVRRRGHVDPKKVEDELPKMHEALKKRGLVITMMTTDVGRADDPVSQKVIEVGAKLGVKRYRMTHYRYEAKKGIIDQLDQLKPVVEDLAAFNAEHGIQGLYQNHSGKSFVGATVWDIHYLIRDLKPENLGVAFDIRHAAAESSQSWEVLYRVMKPHIGALYVKDYQRDGRKVIHSPLGGLVDPKFFDLVARDKGYDVPVSLHVEYLPRAGTKANIDAIRTDMAVLKKWLHI